MGLIFFSKSFTSFIDVNISFRWLYNSKLLMKISFFSLSSRAFNIETGIILNNPEVGLPRKWIKNYRAAIHNANQDLKKSKEIPNEKRNEIVGMTSWVKSVNSERYKKLIIAANKLLK